MTAATIITTSASAHYSYYPEDLHYYDEMYYSVARGDSPMQRSVVTAFTTQLTIFKFDARFIMSNMARSIRTLRI